jgi:membrane fusion protein (multidrug efflux system)
MNKHIRFLLFSMVFMLLTACQSKSDVASVPQQNDTTAVQPAQAPSQKEVQSYSTAIKGKIETMRKVPVYSRIAEQIVMFAVENPGEYVKKGQVVARLSDVALRNKIAHARARLEKAEFQYQAILMGQGYKHDNLDAAPEKVKQMARINSGYNEVKAELNVLESELAYCTITAPVSGAVMDISNTLYGAAQPGEPLFYIVDTDHLKVSFEVLENEVPRYDNGAILSVSTVAFPSEHYPATISGFTPVVDDNGMVHIEATLKPHPHLAPGMTAFITVEKIPPSNP